MLKVFSQQVNLNPIINTEASVLFNEKIQKGFQNFNLVFSQEKNEINKILNSDFETEYAYKLINLNSAFIEHHCITS